MQCHNKTSSRFDISLKFRQQLELTGTDGVCVFAVTGVSHSLLSSCAARWSISNKTVWSIRRGFLFLLYTSLFIALFCLQCLIVFAESMWRSNPDNILAKGYVHQYSRWVGECVFSCSLGKNLSTEVRRKSPFGDV